MTAKTDTHQKYYVPEESRIPIVFACSSSSRVGAANAVAGYGTTMLYVGLAAVIFTLALVVNCDQGITSWARYSPAE